MAVLGKLTLRVLRTFVDAWCLWTLWGWFIVPLGVRSITYWHALGLDLLIGLILMYGVTSIEDDADKLIGLSVAKLFLGPIVVGAGWLLVNSVGVS